MAVVASLVLNAVLVKLLHLDMIVGPRNTVVQRPVALAPLSAEQWAANRALRGNAAQPPPTAGAPIVPPKVVKPPEPDMSGQVVAVGPGKNDEKPPEDTRLLAERNSRVEKQTLSRDRRAGYENAAPRPSAQGSREAQAQEQRAQQAEQQRAAQGLARGQGKENRKGKPGDDATEIPDQRGRPRLALKLDTFGETLPAEGRQEIKGSAGKVALGNPVAPDDKGEGTALGHQGGKVDLSQLKPSAAFYDRLAGGPSPDYVEGVVEGDQTLLNAREFKYASYLNRVKEGIATHWDPARAMAARDPDGTRFPPSDRITIVVFSLDERGAVRNVEVVGRSGLDFIDYAAVSAIQEAQPFINPPRAMFGGKEEIPMRFVFRFTVGDIGALRRMGRGVP